MEASNIVELRAQLQGCIDTGERIALLHNFALDHYSNRPLEGLEALEEARALAREIGNRDHYAACLLVTAICLDTLARFDEALVYLAEAEEIYRQSNSVAELAQCANTTGLNYRCQSRYPEAIEKFTYVIETIRDSPHRELLAAGLNNLGTTYYQLSHHHKALEYFLHALEIYEELNSALNTAVLLENISSIYADINDLERSLEYILRALALTQELDNPYQLAHILSNLATIYTKRGEIDKATEALQRALDIFLEIGARRHEGIIRIRLALLHEQREQWGGHVAPEIEQGLQMLQEVNALGDYADSIIEIARIYARHNEPESTIDFLMRELPLIDDVGGDLMRSNAYELLAEAYEKAENFGESLAFAKRYTELKIKMMGEERQRAIAEMQARYDVSHAEREREAQRLRADDLEKLAEERSKQLSVMAMQLIQKNNLLKTIDEKIERLADPQLDTAGTQKDSSDGHGTMASREKLFNSLQSLIKENLKSEEDWKRFEGVYNLVHNNFTQQIAARAPDLSPMELKVCALLHINLSNKEIADILYISVRTVESHRYRIRKKLGLSGTDNLAEVVR